MLLNNRDHVLRTFIDCTDWHHRSVMLLNNRDHDSDNDHNHVIIILIL
jgi:hypothetical protein